MESSSMTRFVLRFTGSGSLPTSTVDKLGDLAFAVVDRTERMLLVEGPNDIARLRRQFGDNQWLIVPESFGVKVPDPIPRPKRAPRR